jgi:[ribosomal protein S5]-alanine N-acetyltransferase
VVLKYGFEEMELHLIEGLPLATNESSVKVLTKLGFKREGTIHERIFFRGHYEDQLILGLLRDEWFKRTTAK